MIFESLKFLAEETNKYLILNKVGSTGAAPLLVGNIAKALETPPEATLINTVILSIVNVEEDRVAKQQENFVKKDTRVLYKNPPVFLNLYIVFAANRTDYTDSLKCIGHIIRFFQWQHVFTPATHPNLDAGIQQLVVDLHNSSFEQTNHLWSILGGKYFPSVMYKIRQITVDENAIISEGGFIKQVQINDKTKLPV